jgi:hypothetical protein
MIVDVTCPPMIFRRSSRRRYEDDGGRYVPVGQMEVYFDVWLDIAHVARFGIWYPDIWLCATSYLLDPGGARLISD